MKAKTIVLALATASLFALFSSAPASRAQDASSVADFYQGKKLQIVVGYGAGAGYDLYARLLARRIGAYIPGEPGAIVQNMPGAGSLRAANYVHAIAPKDGATIGAVDRQVALSAALGYAANMQFTADEIVWLGTLSSYADDSYNLWVRKDAPARTLEELRVPGGPRLKVGGSGVSSGADTMALVLRDALKLNIDLVKGYPDGAAIALAVDRNEVHASTAGISALATRPQWLAPDGPVRPLVAVGRTTRHPMLPDVPLASELADDDKARAMIKILELPYQIARPFMTSSGIPSDRLAALRKAFIATAADAMFLAEAQKARIDVSPLSGEEVARLTSEIAQSPAAAIEHMRKLLGSDSPDNR
jgi:tripartite-type tricarboxylate transporter receptor subunit TctC